MTASKEQMGDIHEALAKRCKAELDDDASSPAWGNIANAFLKANDVVMSVDTTGALEDLENAQAERKKRRANRFKDNTDGSRKVIPMSESTG